MTIKFKVYKLGLKQVRPGLTNHTLIPLNRGTLDAKDDAIEYIRKRKISHPNETYHVILPVYI